MAEFLETNNYQHRRSGTGFHTPADVHFDLTAKVDQIRQAAVAGPVASPPRTLR